MTLYFTYNDPPSGLYISQVIDTVLFNKRNGNDNRLLALISLRKFKTNRDKIRLFLPDAIVLPMVPGIGRWRMNIPFMRILVRYIKPDVIIGRSVIATQIARRVSSAKIVYDGRGAIAAEWKEYNVVNDPDLRNEIHLLEKDCVLNTDYRIAVSHKLIEFWRKEFGYRSQDHVVIPCTLSLTSETQGFLEKNVLQAKKEWGYSDGDVVCVYSGSVAGWQSFDLLKRFIEDTLASSLHVKFLFLSPDSVEISQIIKLHPEKIKHKFVIPSQVSQVLQACDYGLLIREESVTNLVASPIKFAEYLSCGLKVIISENLGDYSGFVKKEQCGYIYPAVPELKTVNFSEKQSIRSLAFKTFSKDRFLAEFSQAFKAKQLL